MNFVERLEELMYDCKLNRKMLATKLGISQTAVTHYLQGKHFPTLEIFIKIADLFQCSADFLLGKEEENNFLTFKKCPPFCEQLAFLKRKYQCTAFSIYSGAEISKSCYYDWLSGKRTPTVENIVRLSNQFNCRVDFVLGRES